LIKAFSWHSGTPGLGVMAIIVSWALYNAFVVLGGISDVLGRSHERLQSRFPVEIQGQLARNPGSIPFAGVHVRDLSLSGVGFVAADPDLLPRVGDFSLTVHSYHGKPIVLPLAWHLARVIHADGSSDFGVPFAHLDTLSRRRLYEFLFVDMPERWRGSATQLGVGGEPAGIQQPSFLRPAPVAEPILVPARRRAA
jgi:hypothetical protein